MITATLTAVLLAAGDKNPPVYILLPLAFLIPIAVLVIFSRIKPRGGGH